LKGSYAGAMGYGQFIPSSYRNFAVDGDKDGVADIWNNATDATYSVANYFKAHGWKLSHSVLVPAKINGTLNPSLLNTGTPPKLTLAEFSQQGITVADSIPKNVAGVLLSYEQLNGPEYWMGFNNFYAITRYNRSPLYAMAVWQLSEEIESDYAKHNGR
jgi:membrane-bound lytic murein transglycosylase B